MDWVEYDPPAKPSAVRGKSVWVSERVNIEDDRYSTYLLIEFACEPDLFLSDYHTSTVVVRWETEAGISMTTKLVEVLKCRRCTTPNPVVEL